MVRWMFGRYVLGIIPAGSLYKRFPRKERKGGAKGQRNYGNSGALIVDSGEWNVEEADRIIGIFDIINL